MEELLEHKSEKHRIHYDAAHATLFFEGTLRMSGTEEYQSVSALMETVLKPEIPHLILDLTKLEFLNSSGISVLAKFVIAARKMDAIKITVQGSLSIPWQEKSLPNLKKLFPALELLIT